MPSRLLLYACLLLFLGWMSYSHAVPLTEPGTPTTPAAQRPAWQAMENIAFLAQPSADFVCPHVSGISAIECFLNAVEHLYTICRQVKAIELIEFGFDKAEEGQNGLKSEFCRGKQKASLPAYLDAAQREARVMSSCEAVRILNELYGVWETAMIGLRLRPGETEAEYQQRIAAPYRAFAAYHQPIRDALADAYQQPAQNCFQLAVPKP